MSEVDSSGSHVQKPKLEATKSTESKPNGWFGPQPFANLIGKGDQAKDSVVWYLITRMVRWSGVFTLLLCGVDIYYNKGVNCLDILKQCWGVFAPIITLSMGYLFGKRERSAGGGE